ncbi:hypothetical protein DAPPUDRAFT_246289 [Daphnia pulex]|uniref:Uncharacterized protein n=1 Tax=Daphnia pulex TaxID=6669 RepID=E9GQ07_DAPPU|nr:hypothetical protein DAPPUDRAFT_246289 [Daphnia pulex]|eukprot:EFX78479.1 hypothetical protein DAPPUDRAFT_246289 [Daphnia pulex]
MDGARAIPLGPLGQQGTPGQQGPPGLQGPPEGTRGVCQDDGMGDEKSMDEASEPECQIEKSSEDANSIVKKSSEKVNEKSMDKESESESQIEESSEDSNKDSDIDMDVSRVEENDSANTNF